MNDQPVQEPDRGVDPPPASAPPKQSFRDRVWSLRSVVAVALASVILGGLGGAAIASVGDGDDERRGPGHGRFQRGGPDGPPGLQRFREKQRMKEWRREQREDMRERRWGQEGPPGILPPTSPSPSQPASPTPTPAPPTPSG